VHIREGKCLVRSLVYNNLEKGGEEPKLKGVNKPETNLLVCKTIQNRLGADAHLR